MNYTKVGCAHKGLNIRLLKVLGWRGSALVRAWVFNRLIIRSNIFSDLQVYSNPDFLDKILNKL